MENIRAQKKRELIRFEAVSRMYLLNQNVAVEDKNARNYLMDAANVLRDTNLAPFIKNPNPSVEEVREVVRPIAADLGIQLDAKDYEMTEYDAIKEIMRSTAGITDIAIKMTLLNKFGGNAVGAFTEGMAAAGKLGKASSFFFGMMLEEAKFKMIGGHDGTGASFYVANKAFPTFKTANKYFDIILNGYAKGTVGMTVAMEGSHQMVEAYDALANDKDVVRVIRETFGDRDEAQRRILVELISAGPFGIKGMAQRGALHKANAKNVYELAKQLEKEGDHVGAEQLKSVAATLGDVKMYEEMNDHMFMADRLREHGRYDTEYSNQKIREEYKKLNEEKELHDPLKNKKVGVNIDNTYHNPKVAYESIPVAGAIEALRIKGVSVEELQNRSASEIMQKYAEMVEHVDFKIKEFREDTEVAEFDATGPTPAPKTKYKIRASEYNIKQAHSEINEIKKDVNWAKNIKAPAEKVSNTVKKLKAKVNGTEVEKPKEVERPDVTLKVEEADGRFIVAQEGGVKTEFETRGGAEKFITDFELLTQGERTFEQQREITKKKQAEVEGERTPFDKIVDDFSGLKGGSHEFDAMVTRLFNASSKKEALELTEKIEDIVHKVEIVSRPEAERLEYVTRRPSQADDQVSTFKSFKENMAAYRRGIRDGRGDIAEEVNKVREIVQARLEVLPKKFNITRGELARLNKRLSPNQSPEKILSEMEKINNLFDKLQHRIEASETRDIINKGRKVQEVGDKEQQLRIDFTSWSKLRTADMLFNNKQEAAMIEQQRLRQELERLDPDSYHASLVQGQLEALKYTGMRDMAMERQARLESEAKYRDLSMSEYLEYELLSLVDGGRMTAADAIRAKDIVREINETGRSLKQRQDQYHKIKQNMDMDRALHSMQITREDIERVRQEAITPEAKKTLGIAKKLLEYRKQFLHAHESFISMMERLSADEPGRELWDGHFHSLSNDFYRAREQSIAEYNKTLNEIRHSYHEFYGKEGKELDRILKSNKEDAHPYAYWQGGKMAPFGKTTGKSRGISVDQATKWWEWLHDKRAWPIFEKMGWGRTPEHGEQFKFGTKEATEMMDSLKDFIVEHGTEGAIRAAENRLNVLYPKLYGEGNQTYMNKHNIDLGFRPFYSPIYFNKNVRITEDGKVKDHISYEDLLLEGPEMHFASTAPSFVKASKGAGNLQLNLKVGAEEVFTRYLRDLMHYKHFQEPVDRARRMFRSDEMKSALQAKYKTDYTGKVINKMIDDIARDSAGGDRHPWLVKAKARFVTGVLGVNFMLFPKQMTSMGAFRVGLKSAREEMLFTKNMADGIVNGWDAVMELGNSEFMKNRLVGHTFNKDVMAARGEIESQYKVGKLKPGSTQEWLLLSAKAGDRTGILGGGQAFYRTKLQIYKEKGFSEADAKNKAYEEFVKYAKLTQQSGFLEDQSHIQRYGDLGKYLTLFQNTPQQYYRISLAARRNAIAALNRKNLTPEQREQAKHNLKQAARDNVVINTLMPMFFRAASMGLYMGGDDKSKERFGDDPGMLIALMLGTGQYPTIAGPIMAQAASKYLTGHAFDVSVGGVFQDMVTGIMTAADEAKKIAGAEEYELEFNRILDGTSPIGWSDIMRVVAPPAQVTGVPLVTVANFGKGWYDFFTGRTKNPMALLGLSESARGKYSRSPHWDVMAPFLKMGFEAGMPALENYLRGHTDWDYYKKNMATIQKEFRMYSKYGSYNNEINYLYMADTDEERAEYLLALRDGKRVRKPLLISETVDILFEDPMSPAEYENYIINLLTYGVIDRNVLVEMSNKDTDFKARATKILRKTAK